MARAAKSGRRAFLALFVFFAVLQTVLPFASADCCRGRGGRGGSAAPGTRPRPANAEEAVVGAFTRNTQRNFFKPFMQDAYQAVVRDALLAKLAEFLRESDNVSSSFHFAIASGWARALYVQLAQQYYPVNWVTAAAKKHRELGGKGDFEEAVKGTAVHGHNPRQNFVSQATSIGAFFLTALVSEDIAKCAELPEPQVLGCLEFHEEDVRLALELALVTVYDTLVAPDSSRLFALNFFVLAAAPSCPFVAYNSSDFVAAALKRRRTHTLASIVTKKQTDNSTACEEFQRRLLELMMARGVTTEDLVDKVDTKTLFDGTSLQALFEIASKKVEESVGQNVQDFAAALRSQSEEALRKEAQTMLDSASSLMEQIRKGDGGDLSFQGVVENFLAAVQDEQRLNPFKKPLQPGPCCKDKSKKEKAKIVMEKVWSGMKGLIEDARRQRMEKKEKEKEKEKEGEEKKEEDASAKI